MNIFPYQSEKYKLYYLNKQKQKEIIPKKPTYYENNREKISQRNKNYYEKTKEYYKQYHHDYHKAWYINNKSRFVEYNRRYKDKNNKKCNCDCGGKYIHGNKAKHFKTKKHLKYLTNKVEMI